LNYGGAEGPDCTIAECRGLRVTPLVNVIDTRPMVLRFS